MVTHAVSAVQEVPCTKVPIRKDTLGTKQIGWDAIAVVVIFVVILELAPALMIIGFNTAFNTENTQNELSSWALLCTCLDWVSYITKEDERVHNGKQKC